MIRNYKWSNRFMGSCEKYEEGKAVLVGAPMDFTVSYRPGSRYGPQKIRETSYGLEEYSPYLDADLTDIMFYDAGDLELPFGNIEDSLKTIESGAREIFEDGKIPFFIGGEHLITYPVVRQAYHKYGDQLVLLHFDAHADLRMEYMGQKHSHASVIKRCLEFLPARNVYQLGIRSGTREEFKWAHDNTNFYPFYFFPAFEKVVDRISNLPIYITIDIDVLDPAFACGTGTPEPGGCKPDDIFRVIRLLKGFNVVGMDVVEVSPVYDPSDRTAILAAKIIREGLLAFLEG